MDSVISHQTISASPLKDGFSEALLLILRSVINALYPFFVSSGLAQFK